MKSETPQGPTNIGSYSFSKRVYNSDLMDIRGSYKLDLETQFETIEELVSELLSQFTVHTFLRGIASGLLTFEFMNLANFNVQVESKLF